MVKRKRKAWAVLLSVSLALTSFGILPEKEGQAAEGEEILIGDSQAFTSAVTAIKSEPHRSFRFKLTGDIDLGSGTGIVPIETFEGTLDGDGHVIRNMKITLTSAGPAGLFKTLESGATVKNIKFQDCEFKTDHTSPATLESVGFLAGETKGSVTIEHITIDKSNHISLDTSGVSENIGGIVGKMLENPTVSFPYGSVASRATISACENHAKIEVKSGKKIGGIVGYMEGAKISDCANSGEVTGSTCVGGIVGQAEGITSQIQEVMNTGKVAAKKAKNDSGAEISGTGTIVGGIAGQTAVRVANGGNQGEVSAEVSVKEFLEAPAGKPNPYAGGIFGKSTREGNSYLYGSTYDVINCYTAGKIGDVDAEHQTRASAFSTQTDTKVTHSYYLGSDSEASKEEDFKNGKIGHALCRYTRNSYGEKSITGENVWGQDITDPEKEDYPGSYRGGEGLTDSRKLFSLRFVDWANTWETHGGSEVIDYSEKTRYANVAEGLTFQMSEMLGTPENGGTYAVFDRATGQEVADGTKITADAVYCVYIVSPGGTLPSSLPASPTPTASDEATETPDVSETPVPTPTATATPAVTRRPGATTAPTAASTPMQTLVPATVTPAATSTPGVTGTPAASASPAASATPAVIASPGATATAAAASATAEAVPTPAATGAAEATANPAVPTNAPAVPTPAAASTPEATAAAQTTSSPATAPTNAPLEQGEEITKGDIVFKADGANSVVMEKNTDTNIKTAKIPDTVTVGGVKYKVTSLSEGAYAGCKKLKTVDMGSNVKTIGKGAFQNCTNLKTVHFPDKLKKLSPGAFQNCTRLKSAALPKSTKSIGKACFKNCKSLKSFSIGTVKKTKKGGIELAEEPGVMYGAAPVTISIAASALENCVSLKQVIINSQVQKIGNAAFKQCKKLTSIIVYSLILKKVGKTALTGVHNCKISVPTKKVKPYKTLFRNKGQGKKVVVAKM